MKPFYEHAGITIFHGDCREILPTLPKVDLVLTDPPYGIGYNAQKQNLPNSQVFSDISGDFDSELVEWLMLQIEHSEWFCVWGANTFPKLLPFRGRWCCWD